MATRGRRFELVGDRAERAVEVLQIQAETVQVKLDTGQVVAFFAGLVLLEMQNVAIVTIDEFGDRGIQTFAVWALDEQNGGVFHLTLRNERLIVRDKQRRRVRPVSPCGSSN